jgi:hypothetical protein
MSGALRTRLAGAVLTYAEVDIIIDDFLRARDAVEDADDMVELRAGMRSRLRGLIPLPRALAIVADDEASEIPATSGSTPPDEFRQSGDSGGPKS